MYHIGEALVRWVAPILSFTAEEIWENLPGERLESVFLAQWYDGLHTLDAGETMGRDYWQELMAVRAAVNKEMEARRAAGELRGSLDAQVSLYAAPELLENLQALGDELRFVLITSAATLAPLDTAGDDATESDVAGLRLQVTVSEREKCERCWHRREDVGQIGAHPTLCGRCVENIDGNGEQRRFA
jgi:isoleucyl-tRNA synthetase